MPIVRVFLISKIQHEKKKFFLNCTHFFTKIVTMWFLKTFWFLRPQTKNKNSIDKWFINYTTNNRNLRKQSHTQKKKNIFSSFFTSLFKVVHLSYLAMLFFSQRSQLISIDNPQNPSTFFFKLNPPPKKTRFF